jgi:hypothetical protein
MDGTGVEGSNGLVATGSKRCGGMWLGSHGGDGREIDRNGKVT